MNGQILKCRVSGQFVVVTRVSSTGLIFFRYEDDRTNSEFHALREWFY